MKRVVRSAALLAVVAAAFSFPQSRWFSTASARSAETPRAEAARAQADPYNSEAAYRHRTCQPRHWRGMMLQQ